MFATAGAAANSRKRQRELSATVVLRRSVPSVFASSATKKPSRKQTSRKPRIDNGSSNNGSRRAAGTEEAEEEHDTATDNAAAAGAAGSGSVEYHSMLQELANRAKVRAKQQLVDMAAAEGMDEQEDEDEDDHGMKDEDKDQKAEEEAEEDSVTQRSERQPRQQHRAEPEGQPEESVDEDEDDEEGKEDEQADAAEGGGETSEQQAEEEDGIDDAEEARDIDDPSQPATLLQSANEADKEDEDAITSANATSSTSDPSSVHPDLLSSDRFLSHFSHHRTLPAEVLSQLSGSTAQLQPLPPIEGIRERLFTLNLRLLSDDRQRAVGEEKQQASANKSADRADEKAEDALGVPALSAPVWLRDLHVRPKIAERWQPIAVKQKTKQRKKIASASASSSTASSSTASASPALLDDDLPHPLQRTLVPLLSTYRDVVYPALYPSSAAYTFTARHTPGCDSGLLPAPRQSRRASSRGGAATQRQAW